MSLPFNFSSGTWASGRNAAAGILVAGDWAPIRAFEPLIENDPEKVYHDLLPVLQDTDFTLVNLEASLSDTGTPVCKSGAVFKGRSCHVKGLTAAGVDAVTLANNHVFDFGVEAFCNTVETLDRNGIAHTGAGMTGEEATAPLKTEINGVSVAVVNFSEGEDMTTAGSGRPGVAGWDIPAVEDRIARLRKEVDIVIAVGHCGLEYIPVPPTYVLEAFEAAARAGADAVIGHHPHVPQGIRFCGSTPICFSLGNFVFYQPTKIFWRKFGYLVRLGVDKAGLTDLSLIPYRIHDRGVQGLTKDETRYFLSRFEEISTPLATREGARNAWNGFLDYYGPKGFRTEVTGILQKMAEEDPGKGAAMFRNRLTCAQHFHHWQDFLHRMVAGEAGSAPAWAKDLAREWMTRELTGDQA